MKNLCEADGRSVIRLSGLVELPYGFSIRRVLRNSTSDSWPEPVSPQDEPDRALAHAPHRSGDRPPHTPRGPRKAGRHDRSGTLPPVPERSAVHLAVCALSCAVFALVTWQVAVGGPLLALDARLGGALRRSSPPAAVAELLADLGNLAVAVPVLVAACGYAAATAEVRRWLAPVCALAALGAVAVAVSLVKVWLGRPGPLGGVNYYPSGHTATAAVAYGGAALLLCISLRRLPYWLLPAGAAVLTALCGAGLVWRGYHWPLDVVASWCLSWVLLASAAAAVRRGTASRRSPDPQHPHNPQRPRPRQDGSAPAAECGPPDTPGPGPTTGRPDR